MRIKDKKTGKFLKKYTDEDIQKFCEWLENDRDFNDMVIDIMTEYRVSAATAYNWIHIAGAVLAKKK